MHREKKMDRSTKTDDANNNKNWQENNHERKSLKAVSINIETKSEEVDYYKSFSSDITFTIAAAPAKVQAHSASATTGTVINGYPTIKGIFAFVGAWMQVSYDATQSSMGTIPLRYLSTSFPCWPKRGILLLTKEATPTPWMPCRSQTAILVKNSNYGDSNNNLNGEINSPYLLDTLSSFNNEDVHSTRTSDIFLALPMS